MGSQIAKCHAFSAQVVGFTEVSRATLEPRAWSRGQRNGQVYHTKDQGPVSRKPRKLFGPVKP